MNNKCILIIVSITLLIFATILLSGCQTVSGIGKDLEVMSFRAQEAIEPGAHKEGCR